MAREDLVLFNSLEDEDHASTDVYKVAIIDNGIVPGATTTQPNWGGGGTTDFSTREVAAGGNYIADGQTLATVTVTRAGGNIKFDADNLSWAQDVANPTNAYYLICYNDTLASKACLFFVKIATDDATPVPVDMSSNNLSYTFAGTGIFTKTITNP